MPSEESEEKKDQNHSQGFEAGCDGQQINKKYS